MFTWSAHSPQARQVVARVPAVSATMFIQAESDLQRHGVWGACAGPLRGIPYKVYAVEAPAHSMLWVFLAVTIPARLWRFVVVWLGFAGAGVLLRKFGRSSFAPSLHLLFWVVTYAIYWATV